jgi:predicted RNase H-related nuclease YkuK (DUF458 family)|tara:strand:- start:241 stop:702 length:462 start_codon:yes stop_codon:yes gene_type:complete
MIWKDGSSENIAFYEIIQKIKTHNKKKGQVFIGTDSHIKQGKCTFTTSIVLLGAEEQAGGIYFYNKEKYNEPTLFYNRILKEAEKSINLAIKISEICPSTNLEIHMDVSPEEKNEKTSKMAKMLMGYATGSGFKCKIKPDSFAATTVADKHTK